MSTDNGMWRTRSTCRLCGSAALTPVLGLGQQYPAGWLVDEATGPDPAKRVPIELVRCDRGRDPGACGLVQLRHTVSSEKLYAQYFYQSGINQSMRSNLESIVGLALRKVSLDDGDLVLDIGCNDGTLLSFYPDIGLKKTGFDPSDVALEAIEAGNDVVRELFSSDGFQASFGSRKAKVITSIAMLYDLEDPDTFVNEVAKILDKDGLWISEQSYLPLMLERNAFDSICHEHLDYFSLEVLERLAGNNGLEIVFTELNDVNGGSIRFAAAHKGRYEVDTETVEIKSILERREKKLGLHEEPVYREFRNGIERIREDLLELLNGAKEQGKLVHGYGASTKGNTVLQYCGIGSELLPAIADRNPRKWGRYTIGSHIKIIPETESREQKPDYYLVLPWHFLEEFRKREAEFLSRGGKFIIPMPQVHLVG